MPDALSPDATAAFSTQALRAIERRVQADLGDAWTLMDRAGRAAWRHALARWPGARRILVACGPGNNGGDGYVFAREAAQAGREVEVVQAGAPRSELARRAHADCAAAGVRIVAFEALAAGGPPAGDGRPEATGRDGVPAARVPSDGVPADGATAGGTQPDRAHAAIRLPDADLVVDAVLGIGLSRAPDATLARVLRAMDAHPAPLLAIDVPSGVDADTGSVPGVAIHADATLQMLAPHPGLLTCAALDHVGDVAVAGLGVEPCAADGDPACYALPARALRHAFPARRRDSHKGDNGHVLCIGGDHGSGGAILLAAEAALRCGAGLVSVATRPAHVSALLARRPEAMVHACEDADSLAPLLARADVVAIGPGLGREAWGRGLLDAALACGRPLVLDADALNLLAGSRGRPPPDAVLTPHPGEAGRLLGTDAASVQADRYAALQALCALGAAAVVLKGAGTLVAAPGAPIHAIAAGNPGMAVGGMGDLLTGVIAALRAQRMEAFAAAAFGALLHAAAGDAAAEAGGRGLLPSDLLPWLRRLANPESIA